MTHPLEDMSLLEPTQRQPGELQPPHDPASYVLVVDDESAFRDLLARYLEGWGYVTKKAGSAAEALELMIDKPASLVLCDVKMPGQDGLWLADRLHVHWLHTPVVMVTAIDDLETIRESRDSGVVDYVTKPINAEQLRNIVRRAATTATAGIAPAESTSPSPPLQESKIDAEYTLETPVRCPACGERIASLKAVRLIRATVTFTSTLPRRGRVVACPHCLAVIPAELTNF